MQEDQTTSENEIAKTGSSPVNYNIISPTRRGGGGKKLLFFLIVLLLIGALAGGFFFINGQRGNSEETIPTPTPTEAPTSTPPPAGGSPTPTEKPTPTAKPSPTPTKKPTKSLSIRVLNGGGVTGAAKDAADYLSGLGYEIVGTGNANDIGSFETTTIEIKKDKESLLAQLKIDLETKYTLGTTPATLSATESADAVVTVGKK